MDFDRKNYFSDDENIDDSINFREVVEQYLVHYKWFIFCISLFTLLAFFYLRNQVPKYDATSTILIKDVEDGSSVSNLSSIEGLGLFGSKDKSLENEIHLLTSRRLMKNVVRELKLNVKYYIEDSPYNKEQYPNFPIILNFESDLETVDNIGSSFEVIIQPGNKFEFFDFNDNSLGIKSFGEEFVADLGNEDRSDKRSISINFNKDFGRELSGEKILVEIRPLEAVVDMYNETNLIVEPLDDRSRVLRLIIRESIKQKGVAIINNLIEQYNADAVDDKSKVYEKTTEFLNDRIILITSELNAIESTAEQFKTNKGMIDPKAGAELFLETSSMNESELIDASTQLQLISYMTAELNKNNSQELLPANIGLADPSIISLIGEFNSLILQRNRILKSSSIKNPIIVGIDAQLIGLKNNLIISFENLRSSTQIKINSLNKQGDRISSRIASVPRNEREFKDIVRQQETKNAVYLFLLQKREESILSNSITVDKARVVDLAYSNGRQVSPKNKVTYLAAILLGLILPAAIIYLKDIMDTKVHDEKDIRNLKIPYLGDVPLTKAKKDILVRDGDNSNIAEAFRYIRTNINFMLDNKSMGKTIFVTSTVSGEGKTFTAINLACSLAVSGKKTLLLGLDLRAPKITKYLDLEPILGVTNFIKNSSLTLNEITEDYTEFKNLHLINSGDVPPNPVELLMSKRVSEIFEEVSTKYEYIIVDTAPVGMVTDTIQISKYSDLTMYVVKADFLDKRMLHIPDKLNRENKLPNMAILINGSDHSKGAYGYGYGYGYGKKKSTPWYKKVFKNAAL